MFWLHWVVGEASKNDVQDVLYVCFEITVSCCRCGHMLTLCCSDTPFCTPADVVVGDQGSLLYVWECSSLWVLAWSEESFCRMGG